MAGDIKENPPTAPWGLAINSTGLKENSTFQKNTSVGEVSAPRTFRVLYSDDELSRACAHRVARYLAAEWWTESVQLWPRDLPTEDGAMAPDFIFSISTEDVSSWPMPLFQTIQGRLLITGSCSSYPMGCTTAFERIPLAGSIEIQSDAKFKFHRIGCALGGEVIGGLADSLSGQIHKLITEPFRDAANSGYRVEHRPAELQPRRAQVPAPIATLDLQPLGREHGPHVHERAWYRFVDPRPAQDVLMELNDALETLGWNPSWGRILEGETSVLRMDLKDRQITIGRWPRPERQGSIWINTVEQEQSEPVSESPFIVTLVSYFTDAEYEALAKTYATDPIDVEALLAIQSKVRAKGPLNKLRAALRNDPNPEVHFWLTLARLDRRAQDYDSANSAVRIAYALSKFNPGIRGHSDVTNYAKQIEIELPPPSEPADLQALLQAGFLSITQEIEAVTCTLGLGEQARYLRVSTEGPPSQLRVRALSLVEDAAIGVEYKSHAIGQRTQLPIGQAWSWGLSGSSFQLESELRDGEIEIRVSPGTE